MQTAAQVLQVLRKHRQGHDSPKFLAVGFHKPHIPFKFPAHYLDLVPSEQDMILAPDPTLSAWMAASPGSVAFDTFTDVRSRQVSWLSQAKMFLIGTYLNARLHRRM
eukprot:SAG31_NODE_1833_length_7137_cov_2.587667_6_plen_107_part_00